MILEEIEGSVSIMYAGKTLSVGDFAEDYSKGVFVVGSGKAIFRVDPNATFEIKGVEAENAPVAAPAPAPAPAPVELTLFAESTVKAVEAPVKVTSKEPAAE